MPTGSPGVPKSPEHRAKLRVNLAKARAAVTPESLEKMAATKRGKPAHNRGVTKPDATYTSVHNWLRQTFPRTGICAHCGTNVGTARSGGTQYSFNHHPAPHTRNRADYEELCRPCHSVKDRRLRAMIDGPVIQVRSGGFVAPLNPWSFAPRIEDIAHALSNQCRFSGHTSSMYSVSQHSCLVSDLCPREDKLWGLLHDASEAYLVDLPRPLKHDPVFGGVYRAAEEALQNRICHAFDLSLVEPESVKAADLVLLETERRDLMPSGPAWLITAKVTPLSKPIRPWLPSEARDEFLARYATLTARVAA